VFKLQYSDLLILAPAIVDAIELLQGEPVENPEVPVSIAKDLATLHASRAKAKRRLNLALRQCGLSSLTDRNASRETKMLHLRSIICSRLEDEHVTLRLLISNACTATATRYHRRAVIGLTSRIGRAFCDEKFDEARQLQEILVGIEADSGNAWIRGFTRALARKLVGTVKQQLSSIFPETP